MQNIIQDAIEDDQVEEQQVPAIEPEAVEDKPEVTDKPKAISLDEALAKAFDKHLPEAKVAADAPVKAKGPLPNTPAPEPTAKPIDPITGREAEPIKAPAGLTPILREKWASVDPTVQKYISDRELHIAQTISKTGDDRKLAQEARDVFAPYEATLRQFNVTGVQLTRDLMTQWHAMQTGPQHMRAQIMHGLLNHFLNEEGFGVLGSLAQGQKPPAQQPQVDVHAEVQKALAARDEERQMTDIKQAAEAFANDPAHEFYGDVKELMGKILTAELAQGNTLPELYKNAYDMACQQHSGVREALTLRQSTVAPAVQAAAARPKPVATVKPSLGSGAKSKAPVKSISSDDAVREAMRRHGYEV